MPNCRVWVATPSFRSLHWLPRSVASVADQAGNGVDVHHHVQDGGSDDGTREWLENYAEQCARTPRPGYTFSYESTPDGGMYEALNTGWRKAPKGIDILAHLNSDEQYLPGALQTAAKAFAEHPTWEVLLADMIVADINGNYLCHRRSLKPSLPIFLHTCGGMTAATFQRASVFQERGFCFEPEWRIIGDKVWYLKMLQAGVVIGHQNTLVSVFMETGANLGWSAAVHEEGQRFADRFLNGSTSRIYLFTKWAGLCRICKEWFLDPPKDYAVYTPENLQQRRVFPVTKPTVLWGKKLDPLDPSPSSVPFNSSIEKHPKTGKPRILIVDPIFRGSRLALSCYAAQGFAQTGVETHVLTRRDASIAHYHELFDAVPHVLHPEIDLPQEIWFAKLTPKLLDQCMWHLRRLHEELGFTAVFFTGWNEFFPSLVLRPCRNAQVLSRLSAYAIDYDPGFWLPFSPESSSLKTKLKTLGKRIVTRIALKRFRKLTFVICDERVAQWLPKSLQKRHVYAPDPSPPVDAEPSTSPCGEAPVVLAVGLQTKRKGLSDIVNTLEICGDLSGTRIHLVGRLSAETEPLRERLRNIPPEKFAWTDGFLPEEQIRQCYSESDYVLLPYSNDFHCTSGVLANACAHGKPIIATEHGLVGYRVKTNHLGFTYAFQDIDALGKILKALPPRNSAEYLKMSENSRRFAATTSSTEFQNALHKAIFEGLRF